ncbi:MAG TPA: PHP domain-containing protein [Candidatus Omnitrophota bacterium]|nr:PHP domain-containing protein [Candidatus Omnitrophota bacterium]HPS20314.1 PHP domain-containing protein [Candidatus Omnitrophota bacterium]
MKAPKNEYWADLHVHTNFSDGVFSPKQVVENAERLHLAALAITDHDCIDGVVPGIKASSGKDIEVIPGIEISCVIKEREIHILGFFIDVTAKELTEKLSVMRHNRVGRMKEMIRLIRKKGIEITEQDVIGPGKEGTIGRLHLVKIMREKGLVRSVRDAFDKYVGDGKCCFVPHPRFEYYDAIRLILNAGGVPVLAHPALSRVDKNIPALVEAGLRGLEVYHTEHDAATSEKYLKMAKKMSLIVTGGSDCHGPNKGEILMGKVSVGREIVDGLRDEWKRINV